MPGELSYTLDRPFLIPLHTAVQRALVWTGNDVLLTSLATSGKDKLGEVILIEPEAHLTNNLKIKIILAFLMEINRES